MKNPNIFCITIKKLLFLKILKRKKTTQIINKKNYIIIYVKEIIKNCKPDYKFKKGVFTTSIIMWKLILCNFIFISIIIKNNRNLIN